ncbi:MAG: Rne/Rng family ribonuclease [Deltaproteobacteria bacterium]|nr:Rne/Rng family ribonuclease [Deltaproteobacteria bacterium]
MVNTLIINSNHTEVRLAVLKNGTPVELHVERRADRQVVGNVYRGRVVRVLPGMQAAFVDIGIERTGFLYVNDAIPRPAILANSDENDIAVDPDDEEDTDDTANTVDLTDTSEIYRSGKTFTPQRRGFRQAPLANIAEVLKTGQEILVQVQKEPLGQKGARLTRHIALPGRYLVLMPFTDHVGVSHRIAEPVERERLRDILASEQHNGIGFIVRTVAEEVDEIVLRREAKMLMQLWANIEKRGASGPVPSLIFEDFDLVLRAARDFFSEEVEKIICDSAEDHKRISDFMKKLYPDIESRLEVYRGRLPIFDHYGVEIEIARALDRRVWLKSGGYIIIDQAEALTAIDVNSGRFVGKSSLEDTITQINLEAVKEIAYQLRLRNIGGIIIIDFIDMTSADNREQVLNALALALEQDRAKTAIVRMSEIGLIEMTRKRVRDSLGNILTEDCPYCKGRGFVKSLATVAHELLRAIVRILVTSPSRRVHVSMSSSMAAYLYAATTAEIEQIETTYNTQIIPVARDSFHREHYEIVTD